MHSRVRTMMVVGALVAALTGCGDDVAALAESRPESTVWASGAGEGASMVAGEVGFAGGAVIGPRVFTPAMARPGEPMEVRFAARGVGEREVWVGLRAPRAAGREEVAGQSRRISEVAVDERDRWVRAAVIDGEVRATIELPVGWHAMHSVWLIELREGERRVATRTGPRIARGPGVLGVVPVATRPTVVYAPRAGEVTIDGRVEEGTWARAATLLAESVDGEPDPTARAVKLEALGEDALAPGRGTTVRVAWDPDYLYVAASLPDADMWSEYAAQDDPLYKQEAFELFIAASGEGTRYLEYEVSARGVTFDARFARYRVGDEAWDSAWRTAVLAVGSVNDVRTGDRGWSTELAIPWVEVCEETGLVCPPEAGMKLRINAFRLERPDRKRTQALALSPTRAPDFHAWANAAELELR